MLMPNIYSGKKVCLIAPGKSLDKHQIEFDKYEIVVGINRLYKTSFVNKINILYHHSILQNKSVSVADIEYMITILKNEKNFLKLICCPFLNKKNKVVDILSLAKKNNFYNYSFCPEIAKIDIKPIPLTGMVAINHIISSGASFVDMFGFDFYSDGYIENLKDFHLMHKKYHNIESNKKFLQNLIERNPEKISWKK